MRIRYLWINLANTILTWMLSELMFIGEIADLVLSGMKLPIIFARTQESAL